MYIGTGVARDRAASLLAEALHQVLHYHHLHLLSHCPLLQGQLGTRIGEQTVIDWYIAVAYLVQHKVD